MMTFSQQPHIHQHPQNYEFSSIQNCSIKLKNSKLWEEFHNLETEMIITKTGRRMFPSLNVEVSKLDPKKNYCVYLEMSLAARCRFKYSSTGGWSSVGNEEAQSAQRFYQHPESPASGEYWMSQNISFGRMKLTNTRIAPSEHLVLNSMHKYQPTIVICETSDPRMMQWAPKKIITFPETQFIAVTAYQNSKITSLKIDNNPFAKGFRENGKSKYKRKINGVDNEISNENIESSSENCDNTDRQGNKRLKIEISEDQLSPSTISSTSPTSSASFSPSEENLRADKKISADCDKSRPDFALSNYYKDLRVANNRFYFNSPHSAIYDPMQAWREYNYGYNYFYPPCIMPCCYFPTVYQSIPRDLSLAGNKDNTEEPRKFTDFSIKAITGLM